MAFNYVFVCKPKKSGVWEQRFEVTPGEHGIKMIVKLNVGVTPMSGDRNKVLGAVEEIKLINWPEGVDGRIEVQNAYYGEDKRDAPYKTKFKGSPPENLLERAIAYKRVITRNNRKQITPPMLIRFVIDWLPNESGKEYSYFDAKSNPNPDLKLKSSDGVHLYLKGDWIDGYSTLLKQYREGQEQVCEVWLPWLEFPRSYGVRARCCSPFPQIWFAGNYSQKMSKSDDGCFECPEFDYATLRILFCYGQYKKLRYFNRFADVMRAADFFGANRACGELFAMETRRLIYKGRTKDNGCEGTNPMSVREYLDLWHHAINYNFPEMKMMLARHTHWFIDELRANEAIWDEYCKLVAGISEKH